MTVLEIVKGFSFGHYLDLVKDALKTHSNGHKGREIIEWKNGP